MRALARRGADVVIRCNAGVEKAEGVRGELAPTGVHVLVVAPGTVDTAFQGELGNVNGGIFMS